MAYPQAGWPPLAHPAAYVAPGPRPWFPPPGFPPPQAYAYPIKPPEPPPKDDYWATELNDNPLGLENMHIRAESDSKESDSNTSSSSTTRVPSSSVYSRASDYAARNSYPPPNVTGKNSSLTPSRSHPNTRGPSPARPRHHERTSERVREIAAPTARYASYSGNQTASVAQAGNISTNNPPSSYQRPSSRSLTGRTSVPAESGGRYSSASSSAAAYAAQMANRSQTLPGASYHSRASATVPGSASRHAQAMQRSRTLPNEVLIANPSRERARETSRRSSDHYAYRYPDDDDDDETDLEEEEDGSLSPSWVRVDADSTTKRGREKKKDSRTMDRDADRINGAQRTGSPIHDSHLDPSGREGRQRKSREKLKSDSYQQAYAEGDYDARRRTSTHDASGRSAAEYARERHQERDAVERRSSAPYSTHGSASVFDEGHGRNVSLADAGAAIMAEEPADMHGNRSTRRSPSYYPRSQRNEQERKWSNRQKGYSGSSSSSGSDSESEDDAPHGRRLSERERQGSAVSVTRMRRVSDRGDTLRPEDGENLGTATQANAYLPSPRSLRQSNRTPSTRPSYEQVATERGHDRTKMLNGHVPVSVSSASAGVASRGHVYSTPPVTPNRQDQTNRTAAPYQAYASQATSSASAASAAALAADTDPTRTPPRSTYIYRGSTASPSPHHSTSSHQSSRSYAQPSQHLQPQVYIQEPVGQYVASYPTETKYKRHSPHASRSRSPSPLPPGQKISSSSTYYATLGHSNAATPSRTQARSHGHSQAYEHDHLQTSTQAATQAWDVRQRSSSRAGVRGNGYSSASASAAAVSTVSASASANSATQAGVGGKRHVRAGFWNRRGDHLTENGYVVYCPPGRCYPRDLRDYPDSAFKDHLGNVVEKTADAYPELPESIPRIPGRAPERPYDSFISFVLVTDK